MSGTSPTLLLVLRRLKRADGRSLLKLAVKELVHREVLAVVTQERRRRGRRAPGPRVLLVDGPSAAPPSRALQTAHRHVEAAPSAVHDGRPGRELSAVAKHLARSGARREVLDAAIVDLTGMGLVREEERRVLGLVRRRVLVRTAGGDALLEKDERRREAGPDGGTPVVVLAGDGSGVGDGERHDPDPDAEALAALDAGVDGAFDGSLDSAFDSSFDSAFDQSFDSAFDSGFSDGGGGGGDGGGGGGDGGGGGGGD